MSNVILALLTRTQTAPAILAGAARLAALLEGARIEAMAIRVPPISTILVTEEILSKGDEQKLRAQEAERVTALRRIFDDWTQQRRTVKDPRWIDEEGITENLVKTRGQRADYIVVGRPDALSERSEHEALYAALFATDRPVLMMPPQASENFGKILAIAWRDDKFTLRALLAALRCVPHPEEVHVLMGRRPADPPPHAPDVLAEHDIEVTEHELPIGKNVFGAQLLGAAHELHADLLVMGAFTHNAWHNLMFGGVTRHVLAYSEIPVLMRH